MKLLHISHRYYPAIGGIEVNTKEISERLVELGERLTVFTADALTREDFFDPNHSKTYLPLEETTKGVDVKRFPINHKLNNFLFKIMPKIRGGYRLRKLIFKDAIEMLKYGPFIPKMIWGIVKLKPDIVLAQTAYYATTYFCYLAKKIYNFKLVLIPSIQIPTIQTASKWLENTTVYKILKSSDLVISLTNYEKEFLIKKGIDEKKISVIGCGVDPLKFTRANGINFKNRYNLNNEPIVAYIGRRSKEKNIEGLIDAMRIVWKSIPNAKLVLAGAKNSSYEAIERNKINCLDINERKKIISVDAYSKEEKPDIFAACDVFAMPSNVESFGIVYLEAWLCGKPVIACKDSPPSTLIDNGEDGLLVKYGNKYELATAILKLLNDKKMRMELGEEGKKKVLREYTWDIIARKIRKQYYKLVNNELKR